MGACNFYVHLKYSYYKNKLYICPAQSLKYYEVLVALIYVMNC